MGSFPRLVSTVGLAISGMLAALPAQATAAVVVPEPESLSAGGFRRRRRDRAAPPAASLNGRQGRDPSGR